MRLSGRFAIGLFVQVAALGLGSCWSLHSPRSGDVLFQDSFEHPSSGWDQYQGPDYRADYGNGTYRFEILEPNTTAWSTPNLSLRDVQIEVDVRKVSGPDDNLFGVLCRYQDGSNFYFFLVSSDGYVGIGIRQEGQSRLLGSDTMLPHPAVRTSSMPNHLTIRCVASSLELAVNGEPVASAEVGEWPAGDVGLIAGAYDAPGVVIEFERFSVLLP